MTARSSFRFIGSAHHLLKQHASASGIALQQAVAAKAGSVSSSRLGRAGLDSSTTASGLAASHPFRTFKPTQRHLPTRMFTAESRTTPTLHHPPTGTFP